MFFIWTTTTKSCRAPTRWLRPLFGSFCVHLSPPAAFPLERQQQYGWPLFKVYIIQLQTPEPLIEINNLTWGWSPSQSHWDAGPAVHTPPREEQASGRDKADGERGREKGARETGVQQSHTEQCQGLGAYWDADKVPGHFYRQTTYFRPHIAWEDW